MPTKIQEDGARGKSGGRVKGTPNKLTADNKSLQDFYMEQGYKSVSEIAFLTANDLFEIMEDIKEEYGVDSKEFNNAVSNSIKATATALPYFTSQFKTLVITTTDEDGAEKLNAAVEAIKNKFAAQK